MYIPKPNYNESVYCSFSSSRIWYYAPFFVLLVYSSSYKVIGEILYRFAIGGPGKLHLRNPLSVKWSQADSGGVSKGPRGRGPLIFSQHKFIPFKRFHFVFNDRDQFYIVAVKLISHLLIIWDDNLWIWFRFGWKQVQISRQFTRIDIMFKIFTEYIIFQQNMLETM